MPTSILFDFAPYTWYDIGKYPHSRSLSSYEAAPRVSLAVKYYDPASDSFKYYKVRDTAYAHEYRSHGSDLLSGWNCPSGHRPIGFMHDGDDLPTWKKDNSTAEGADLAPALLHKTLSELKRDHERQIEQIARERASEADQAEDISRSAETILRGEEKKLAHEEGSSPPDCWTYNGGHIYNERGICVCGADVLKVKGLKQ